MLIFNFDPHDSRTIRLLDHEIPNYLTDVIIHSYNLLCKDYPDGIYQYEYIIAQELIIMYIRRAIKQGHIDRKEIMIKGEILNKPILINFDQHIKPVGIIPTELYHWPTLAMELF